MPSAIRPNVVHLTGARLEPLADVRLVRVRRVTELTLLRHATHLAHAFRRNGEREGAENVEWRLTVGME